MEPLLPTVIEAGCHGCMVDRAMEMPLLDRREVDTHSSGIYGENAPFESIHDHKLAIGDLNWGVPLRMRPGGMEITGSVRTSGIDPTLLSLSSNSNRHCPCLWSKGCTQH